MSKKKKKWSKTRKVIISLVTVMIVLVGTVFGFYKHVKNKIYIEKQPSSASSSDYKEVDGITNVLLIGSDARDLDEPCRSDSMIIATIDNNSKKVKLTSLFRDTLVNIPGYGEAKLNTAYMLGGADLLMDTIKETYNVSIDKYIVINFWGFEAVVDYIGGIEVDVKDYQLEELNKYIGESTGGNDCPVTTAGVQTLNGKQALSYARIRYNVGDEYARTDRQREVIFKVIEKLKDTKPSKYLGIMNTMLEYIKTNIDPLEALNMAYTIYKFPNLQTEQLQMPIVALAEARNYKDLGSVFLMDRLQNANFLYNFIYEDKFPNEENYDYDSLTTELQKYADEEAVYNQKYNINPDDYLEIEDGGVTRSEDIITPSQPIYTTPSEPIYTAPSTPYIPEDDYYEPSYDNNYGGNGQVPPGEDNTVTTPPAQEPPADGGSSQPEQGGNDEAGSETPDSGATDPVNPDPEATTENAINAPQEQVN